MLLENFPARLESINCPFTMSDPNICHCSWNYGLSNENMKYFTEISKCPQVLLKQIKLYMTSSLWSVIPLPTAVLLETADRGMKNGRYWMWEDTYL